MNSGDLRYIADIRRELSYAHWTAEERKALRLALKWFYQAHGRPVPIDLL